MFIKKGDIVLVTKGKDRGKQGKVLTAFPKQGRVVIEGVNVVKRHQRPRKSGEKGSIVEKPMPLDVSNVALIDPETKKPARIGWKDSGGKKIRVSKKSGAVI
jgi:large subunit ribosomal protein L24